MRIKHNQDGITLLVTLLLMGVLMSVGASLLNITLMQYQLSSIALSSEMAFQAANAGVECALYYDLTKDPVLSPSPFEVGPTRANITCMGQNSSDSNSGPIVSTGEQHFKFSWGASGNPVCTDMSVYKFYSTSGSVIISVDGQDLRSGNPCAQDETCTVIQSRGYNVACGDITSSAKVVEREFTQVY